jgi:tetraacyldisaccharide 4'-kinase
MDDGLQNPSLYKDVSLAVFEGISQVGNGRVFPAGPLRQSLSSGLRSVQGVLLLNFQDKAFQEYLERKRQKLSIFHGRIETSAVPTPGRSYVAFAGIGVPQKFFNLLAERGYPLVQTLSFPDHHPYTAQEQDELLTLAQREGAQLVTTEKDAVKLHPSFLDQVDVVEISLTFEDREGVKAWLRGHLQVGV